MKINLFPQVRNGSLTLSKTGDSITVNGEVFDFTPLPEGAIIPPEAIAHEYFLWPIKRVDGVLHISILFPIAMTAPREACFPDAILAIVDGPIALPETRHD